MGIETPEDGPIGDSCALCDGILWPTDETPRFLKAIFTEIVECLPEGAPKPNGTFILEQLPRTPCEWEYLDDDYFCHYRLTGLYSHLSHHTLWGVSYDYFINTIYDQCANGFTNEIVNCNFPHGGKFGTAVVVPV